MQVDLNADVGESFGAYVLGNDVELMRSITSANIACGYHAGDPATMRRTIRLARDAGVAIGAHPGFPDLVGFGRREFQASPRDVEDLVLYQVGALAGIAVVEGVRLQHVKPHGALYNMAARDPVLAEAIARAVASFDRRLILYGPPGSVLLSAGRREGLRVAAEGFADRAYLPDGSLAPRGSPGAVLQDPAAIAKRALRFVREAVVTATDGSLLSLHVDTLCVHGDTPDAAAAAAQLRAGLEQAGIRVAALGSD